MKIATNQFTGINKNSGSKKYGKVPGKEIRDMVSLGGDNNKIDDMLAMAKNLKSGSDHITSQEIGKSLLRYSAVVATGAVVGGFLGYQAWSFIGGSLATVVGTGLGIMGGGIIGHDLGKKYA